MVDECLVVLCSDMLYDSEKMIRHPLHHRISWTPVSAECLLHACDTFLEGMIRLWGPRYHQKSEDGALSIRWTSSFRCLHVTRLINLIRCPHASSWQIRVTSAEEWPNSETDVKSKTEMMFRSQRVAHHFRSGDSMIVSGYP
ncbi:hypothetical protein Mp_1g11720 [Marchantia polymorpha subsp. ruderalis]|uniref:Uncharacterized protein n=2 Tax=Marchantia polymorpha TaxID=3197 RepID=A0AAF6AP37_MARPO|nr:hypothetical protein MARPO_0014s0055 [Marchantia polymorpha]BBM98207.1 hypothetical protein Mp_1g11720 [Marchantia polymorpha subsp. ruderalis]|eukprot:PTQ45513.1 hypothetical protein MARPO_0014s0055 [Marchantia polymorpha]